MKILELTVYSRNLKKQKSFYRDVLGLHIQESADKFTLTTHSTVLHFIENKNATPYHFAFNIPADSIDYALEKLDGKVTVLKDKEEKIVDFPSWNARSVYFYDADKNIVECIGRRNLNYRFEPPFASEDWIEISEIGLATAEFQKNFGLLTSVPGLEKFSGNNENFCAIGDETGLFILVDKNKKDWFPNHDKAFSSAFEVLAETKNNRFSVHFTDDRLTIKTMA